MVSGLETPEGSLYNIREISKLEEQNLVKNLDSESSLGRSSNHNLNLEEKPYVMTNYNLSQKLERLTDWGDSLEDNSFLDNPIVKFEDGRVYQVEKVSSKKKEKQKEGQEGSLDGESMEEEEGSLDNQNVWYDMYEEEEEINYDALSPEMRDLLIGKKKMGEDMVVNTLTFDDSNINRTDMGHFSISTGEATMSLGAEWVVDVPPMGLETSYEVVLSKGMKYFNSKYSLEISPIVNMYSKLKEKYTHLPALSIVLSQVVWECYHNQELAGKDTSEALSMWAIYKVLELLKIKNMEFMILPSKFTKHTNLLRLSDVMLERELEDI
jgi:hypothetical protein